jgi:hypothetical protein
LTPPKGVKIKNRSWTSKFRYGKYTSFLMICRWQLPNQWVPRNYCWPDPMFKQYSSEGSSKFHSNYRPKWYHGQLLHKANIESFKS